MTTRAPAHTSTLALGPILIHRGESGDRVRMSALIGVDGDAEPEDLVVDGVRLPVPPRHVARSDETRLWRFDFAAPIPTDGSPISYGFAEGERWSFTCPARDGDVRVFFAADLGPGSSGGVASWSELAVRVEREPPHLLLLGGGRVDAPPPSAPAAGPSSPAEARALLDAHLRSLLAIWRDPDAAWIAARTPIAALWGPGDVGPGFGAVLEREGPLSRGELAAALASRRAFAAARLGVKLDEPPDSVWSPERGSLIRGVRIGNVGVVTLDPLGERAGPNGDPSREADAVAADITRLDGCRRLLVMTGPPLMTADGGAGVRSRLIEVFAAYGADRDCEVTLLANGSVARMDARAAGFGVRQLCASSLRRHLSLVSRWARERRAARPKPPGPGWTAASAPMEIGGRRLTLQPSWLSLTIAPSGLTVVRRRSGEMIDETVF